MKKLSLLILGATLLTPLSSFADDQAPPQPVPDQQTQPDSSQPAPTDPSAQADAPSVTPQPSGVNDYGDGTPPPDTRPKFSDDDKKLLADIDKTMGANTDNDLLPANPTDEQKADYHMKMFVNRVGLMSGIVGMCSRQEQSLIQECGELVLNNWHVVTGETPPADTPDRREIFRTAWAKREIQALLAVKKMQSPPSCSTVIDEEKADDMWKICKRRFVDHPLDNPDAAQ